MIFDFHSMGDRIGDSMDGFQKIWALFAVYTIVIFCLLVFCQPIAQQPGSSLVYNQS